MRLALASLIAAAALLSGCGSSAPSHAANQRATLVLDFTPNAIHAGIYAAIARGYVRDHGVDLHVIAPSASTDAVSLLATGKVTFAILDIHDLAIARERGENIVGIMAIVERPLASVIAAPAIQSPLQLDGKTVGVTGAASDYAVLRSVVGGAGGNPRTIHTVTIGYDAVPALLSGRVAAATAFWNDEGVTLAHDRPGFHVFRVEQFGAPAYPELVLSAEASTLHAHPGLAESVVRAFVQGYTVARDDPQQVQADLESLVPGLDHQLVAEQLAAIRTSFAAPDGHIGELYLPALRAWAPWEARFGIVSRPPNVAAAFDPAFVAEAERAKAS